jgi:GNAT superfamily N-acetyltransferase
MTDFRYSRHGREAVEMLYEIAPLYEEVYGEPPYNSASLFERGEFLARTKRQLSVDGFTLILARTGNGELAGFSFGLPFGKKWWSGLGTPQPAELVDATKFAVIELVVHRSFRSMGVGRKLLDELLARRSEDFAILTSVPEAPAHAMYLRWGWSAVGTSTAKPDAPVMDAMVLPLKQE